MDLRIRRIGNSLGVIVPKAMLDEWGKHEGDSLELSNDGIRPLRAAERAHDAIDELKRKLAIAVVTHCAPSLIRAQGLANLTRWKTSGAWVSAYDEWKKILESGVDGELFLAMLGRDERSTRLRQAPPYLGLLPRDEVKRLIEEASVDGRILAAIERDFAR
jgi:antitoxin component of MazEF toxin-antitoxin module